MHFAQKLLATLCIYRIREVRSDEFIYIQYSFVHPPAQ